MNYKNKSIQKLRKEIDKLDIRLLLLLAKRMNLANSIGKYKAQNGLPPLDRERWQLVLTSRINLGKTVGLSTDFVKAIFDTIHKQSLLIQKELQP